MDQHVEHPFPSLSNFRDVGGVATSDGGQLRAGMLFRSDAPDRISTEEVRALEQRGLRLVCDLRSASDSRRQARALRGGSIRVVNVPLAAVEISRAALVGCLFRRNGEARYHEICRSYYRHLAFEQMSRLREVLSLLAQDGEAPALIHCGAGRDRTGFVAAVIQLLLGVPYEVVRAEYLRTNDYFAARLVRFIKRMRVATMFQVSEERIRLVMMTHGEMLDDVHAEIVVRHGTIEAYLRQACGLDDATLAMLRQRLRTG